MNYTEIKALALSYSDRDDDEVSNRMDDFLKVVESRVNRKLKTQKMSVRATIATVADQEYYGLPSDFSGLRDIQLIGDSNTTMQYVNPEAMNGLSNETTNKIYYNITANQLQITPPQDGKIIEIVYYRKVPGLTATETTNWLGDDNPDCYTFGLLVEISAFVKDGEAKVLWDDRFKESLMEIDFEDSVNRWSGPTLQTMVG